MFDVRSMEHPGFIGLNLDRQLKIQAGDTVELQINGLPVKVEQLQPGSKTNFSGIVAAIDSLLAPAFHVGDMIEFGEEHVFFVEPCA